VAAEEMVEIPGTHRARWPGSSPARELLSEADVLLTVWLRPKKGGELDIARAVALGSTLPLRRAYAERKDLRTQTDADPAAAERLTEYFKRFGITIVGSHWRSIVISGPIDRLIQAFGATVSIFADAEGTHFRHRSSALHVPRDIAGMLRGVFGLHQWPRSRKLGALSRHATPLSAGDVVKRYDFPDADGAGQTIAVVQFRGEFKPDDFDRCMKAQHVAPARPIVKRVDGAAVAHTAETTKDLEAALDAQILGALAPGARIVIYEAPDDERGFLDAVRAALFDEEFKPSVLSISYGWPEHLWTPAALAVLDELFVVAALLGVSVFCSSGDNGAELDLDGKPHVLAPASSRFVHACGASVLGNDSGSVHEDAWEKSGGGFSEHFELQSWQGAAKTIAGRYHMAPGRGVPDVAAQQDPGYRVFFDGIELALGGTSAVAPMWAALTARLNERLGVCIGHFAPLLYASSNGITRDVTSGNNGRFNAHAGWNPCTGLGVPVGTRIEAALRGAIPDP
jgi:kumamolisin